MTSVIPQEFEAAKAGEVFAGFGRALAETSLEQPLQETAGVFREGLWTNFIKAEGPDGTKWPPRVDNLSHPLLFKSGKMLDAAIDGGGPGAITEVGPRDALLGVDDGVVKYAGYHMTGTKNKDGSERMPARPYYYAGSTALDAMADKMASETLRLLVP